MPHTTSTPHRTQIFQVSTLYGAATLAAALDAGLFGPRDEARRVLLVSNNAAIPETALRLDEMHGYGRITGRFDSVVSWNEAIRPHHPSAWGPRGNDTTLWQKAFRLAWGIGERDQVELAVESIQVNPARALAAIFSESSVHVYADGLMSYGPTREKLPLTLASRVRRLLHLDLVPGLRPLLLSEYGVEPEIVPDEAFRAVLDEISRDAADDPELAPVVREKPTAVLLGQYLAAINILTAREEEDLHVRMLTGAARAGHRSVVFKPHPTAPAGYTAALSKAAADAGVRLTVLDAPLLAETLYDHCAPELVVGCFSTAMVTASAYYDVPVARVGTALVMERLKPYPNSNRVPLAVVDHLVPDLERGGEPARIGAAPESLSPLVRAIGFCMQPKTYAELREPTEAWLRAHLAGSPAYYFPELRLTELGLPGSRPQLRAKLQVRRARRVVRRAVRRGAGRK
ncbi:alpha-2,8-polysialyltransferase family protein [Streptomyces parvulus]|uniref:Alpha-2,8-polysialyltransferase family protein n=1 Tax=Streptomyces parvulus TaxID=146923 RepID=A0ABV5D5E2_9ACTN|nr:MULTISPECIES: alpha-2,8-polysialyltransferase family protein [Streptomyces]MCC9156941.1 alpha-2,8-polysialyltransferase family protein [Streptomyces parvulus]MCE7690558.1 alpha-2,8-polysialyltransferase family protein [Streptomyces parvulus]MCQ4193000.1 alpha-2,8-polysialyltransferase family protein [Streptomyces parvulus]WML82183.1 alpha-2,8-polysialyltransferase family protein [Streptomyces sp. VNUA74]